MRNPISAKKIFLIGALFVLGLFLRPEYASAQTYNALVTIPGIPPGAGVTVYLSGLYNFLISVVGIVAMGAIVIGGARYLTSVGNPSAIEDAKHTIYSAIYGLLIAITSWVIVSTINPDILVLKNPTLSMPAGGFAGGSKVPQCALATGDPKTTGCTCADGQVVKGITPFPPYVVGTSIAPCSASISTALPSVDVIFSEPMDPATLVTANFAIFPAAPGITVAPDPVRSNVAVVKFSGALGPPPQDYSITVNVGVKNAGGTPMAALYRFAFTTGPAPYVGCTAMPIGGGCARVCKDTTLAADTKYHCMKADLRVGAAAHPIGKEVTVKVNETVFFDARTYSYDGLYPNIKLAGDPYVSSSGFDNGIDRYEMCYNADSWIACNPFWTSYGCSEPVPFGTCGVLNWAGVGVTAFFGACGGDSTTYSSAGKYKAVLHVISKLDCTTESRDEVIINVNP